MIRIISVCFILLSITTHAQNNAVDSVCAPVSTIEFRYDSVLIYAQKYIGVKYKYQGTNKNGFDCSGFVQHVYEYCNKTLPHSSAAQALIGNEIELQKLQQGDLVFFKGRNLQANNVGHVGIVMEAKDGHFKMIHSSVHKGVTIDYYPEGEYYRKRYLSARRITFD